MKGVSLVSIIVAALCIVIGIYSRLSLNPVLGLESRAFAGFAALLLLLSIALSSLNSAD